MSIARDLAYTTTWTERDWQQALDILADNRDLLEATKTLVARGYHPIVAATLLRRAYGK